MRTRFFITICILAAAMAAAQSSSEAAATQNGAPPNAQAQGQNSAQFPAGTIIPVELSKSIDAKKARSGDKIEARVPSDLLAHGKILIPRNTKITGHITEVKAHSKDAPDSMVGIVFDRIVMKGGQEAPLQTVVQAVARPLQSGLAEDGGMNAGGNMPSASGPPMTTSGTMAGGMPRSYPTVSGQEPSTDRGPSGSNPAPLGPTSQGVVGMKGLSLNVSGQASVIRSEKDNVRLDSGTQMMLRML